MLADTYIPYRYHLGSGRFLAMSLLKNFVTLSLNFSLPSTGENNGMHMLEQSLEIAEIDAKLERLQKQLLKSSLS